MIKYFTIICLFIGSLRASAQNQAMEIVLKCSPCGMACDTVSFRDTTAACSHCGALLFATFKNAPVRQKTAAILLFPRIDMMDFAWFFEICREAGMNVVTVAETKAPVKAALNSVFTPDFTFDNAPPADFIFIAGGQTDFENPNAIRWIQRAAPSAKAVLAAFNGSHLLARAGLLKGRSATAAGYALERLRQLAPQATIVTDRHFVEDGNIVTAAGVNATIDATLHLVAKYVNSSLARTIAQGLEYHWETPNPHPRTEAPEANDAFLDELRAFLSQFDAKMIVNEGDKKQWTFKTEIYTTTPFDQFMQLLDFQLKNVSKWTPVRRYLWSLQHNGVQYEVWADYDRRPSGGVFSVRSIVR